MRRVILVLVALAAASCGGGDDDSGDHSASDATPSPIDADPGAPDAGGAAACAAPVSGTDLGLQLVAKDLASPVFVTSPPGDPRLFVVEQDGVIKIIRDGAVLPTPFLDITDRVIGQMIPGEQGLLSLAFHPDYATTGRFFVYYTALDSEVAGPEADVLAQYTVSADDPDVADRDSEERLIELPDFARNHNGGTIAFDRDGYLYMSVGDGGGANDPKNNGQDRTTLLGDISRIDVDSDNPYGIPADNPFVGSPGGEREEIWISGLRNPWRWSFDRETGDMYIGDVGQYRWEEIDVIPAGQGAGLNMGWDEVEGDECFDDPVAPGDPDADPTCTLSDFTPPVLTYFHDPATDGGHRAVAGGYVYRGACFPDIQGRYFYADFSGDQIYTFVYAGGEATEQANVTIDIDPLAQLFGVASFGEDAAGELYIVSQRGGTIHRIVVE